MKILKIIILLHLAVGLVSLPFAWYTLRLVPQQLFQQALEKKPYDVIIVPGVPFRDGKWGRIMEARVRWSVYLFEQGITENIIYSGSSVYTPYIESHIMKLCAIELGVPAGNIFTENKAEHSTENLVYSHRVAKRQGFRKIALATDPFQSLVLRYYEEDFQPPIDEIPIEFKLLKSFPRIDISINPDSAFVGDFISITERESFWERLKGTRGKKVKPDESN